MKNFLETAHHLYLRYLRLSHSKALPSPRFPPHFVKFPASPLRPRSTHFKRETCGIYNGVEVSLMNFSLEMGRCFHVVGSRENILEFSKGLTIHLTRWSDIGALFLLLKNPGCSRFTSAILPTSMINGPQR